jgi:hypothetical protein
MKVSDAGLVLAFATVLDGIFEAIMSGTFS